MELQLVDGNWHHCMRINAAEPLWRILQEGLRRVGRAPENELGDRDVTIGDSDLSALLGDLALVLRERLAGITPADAAGHYDDATITVLGEPMRIRVRNPQHYELKRINDLHTRLSRIRDSRQAAHFLAVPDLTTIDHGIIEVLVEAPHALGLAALAAAVRDRFDALGASASDGDVRTSLRQQVESATDAVVAERVERLAHWGLVESGTDGTITATAKLGRIVH